MSVEQTNDFHICRRIARIIAPDYRLFASSSIPEGACVLDTKQKTLEVGESVQVFPAVKALLFQVGHLRLAKDPQYALFFGVGISAWKDSEEALVEKLVKQGVKVDQSAAQWAAKIFHSYWPQRPDIYDDLVSHFVWSAQEWRQYFNSS